MMTKRPQHYADKAAKAQLHGDFRRAAQLWAEHEAAVERDMERIRQLCEKAKQFNQGMKI